MTRLLRHADVSEMIGVPVPTLRDWRVKGKGPRSFRVNGTVVYKDEDVDAWIEEQYAASDGAPAA